jgi:putative heme iron utilization protein
VALIGGSLVLKDNVDVSKQDFFMADPITPQVSDRICKHMNEDHAEAVALYARLYGDTPAATQAEMQSIDPEGMTLMAQVDGTAIPVRIRFDHVLQDSEDAHQTLIAMVRQARQPQK